MKHAVWIVMLVGMLVSIMAWLINEPPSATARDGAPEQFSAYRALDVLTSWRGVATVPHSSGTVAHDVLRGHIVKALEAQGLEMVLTTPALSCLTSRCVWVHNIVATLPATAPKPKHGAIALSAHYDSILAGPGINDDLASVAAIIEVVRALKTQKKRDRDVIVLITDGEELGLLGAKAFYKTPLSKEVEVVVNMEARGSSGPSYLFETSDANAWTINHMAKALSYPHTSSLHQAVYEVLPNGTDFTVHKRYRKQGIGTGYIRNVAHYHSPLDSMERLNLPTLQHQGQQAYEATLAFLDADAPSAPAPIVYTDIMGLTLIHWPVKAGWIMWGFGLVLFGLGWRRQRQQDEAMRWWAVFKSSWSWIPLLMFSVMMMGVWSVLVGAMRDHPSPWWAYQAPWVLAGAALTAALWWSFDRLAKKHCALRERWWGWLGHWGVLSGCLVVLMPSISFLWLIPWLALTIVGLMQTPASRNKMWSTSDVILHTIGWAVTLVLWIPLFSGLLDGVGVLFGAPVIVAAVALLPGCLSQGHHASMRHIKVAWGIAGLLLLNTLVMPVSSENAPMGLNIVAMGDESKTSQYGMWFTPVDLFGRRPTVFTDESTKKSPASRIAMPWTWPADRLMEGPALTRQPAQLSSTTSGKVEVTFPKDAVALMINSDARVRVMVDGRHVSMYPRRRGESMHQWMLFRPPNGVTTLSLSTTSHTKVTFVTIYPGLPNTEEVKTMRAQRESLHGVPVHFGDMTMVARRYTIQGQTLKAAPALPRPK